MPKEIFEVVRERFHLSDRTQYIVQGHWPKDAVMEAYLDQHKLKAVSYTHLTLPTNSLV